MQGFFIGLFWSICFLEPQVLTQWGSQNAQTCAPQTEPVCSEPCSSGEFSFSRFRNKPKPLLSCFLLLNWSFNVFKKFIWWPSWGFVHFCLFIFYLEAFWFFNAWHNLCINKSWCSLPCLFLLRVRSVISLLYWAQKGCKRRFLTLQLEDFSAEFWESLVWELSTACVFVQKESLGKKNNKKSKQAAPKLCNVSPLRSSAPQSLNLPLQCIIWQC